MYVRYFIRKSIEGGGVAALNRYFESNQCEEELNANKKHIKIIYNEVSNLFDEYLKYFNITRDEFRSKFENVEKDYQK